MPEPILFFWALVALLVAAAGCNHGWHHARHSHLQARLVRAAYREDGTSLMVVEPRE